MGLADNGPNDIVENLFVLSNAGINEIVRKLVEFGQTELVEDEQGLLDDDLVGILVLLRLFLIENTSLPASVFVNLQRLAVLQRWRGIGMLRFSALLLLTNIAAHTRSFGHGIDFLYAGRRVPLTVLRRSRLGVSPGERRGKVGEAHSEQVLRDVTNHRLFSVVTAFAGLTHLSGKSVASLPTRIVTASMLVLMVASSVSLLLTMLLPVLLAAFATMGLLSLLRLLRGRLLYNMSGAGNTRLLC